MKRGEEEKTDRGEKMKRGGKGGRGGRGERGERGEREEREREGERESEKSMHFLGQVKNRCKVIIARSMQVQYYILCQFRCTVSQHPRWKTSWAPFKLQFFCNQNKLDVYKSNDSFFTVRNTQKRDLLHIDIQ